MMENLSSDIIKRIEKIKYEIKNSKHEVKIMAVTKTVPPEIVNIAIANGINLLGENRVQELNSKYDFYDKNCDIHFIGSLQTNKVKQIVDKVSMIHSVDSIRLAEEISIQCGKIGKTMDVLVEINIGNEATKSGLCPQNLEKFLVDLSNISNIHIKGLMCIPPVLENETYFLSMQNLFLDIKAKKIDNIDMCYLSMGMSDDYLCGIKYGANIIRLGTAIFGRRI